jgi:hypothetical protein
MSDLSALPRAYRFPADRSRGSPGLQQTSACMPAAKRVFPDAWAGFPGAMAGFEIDLE